MWPHTTLQHFLIVLDFIPQHIIIRRSIHYIIVSLSKSAAKQERHSSGVLTVLLTIVIKLCWYPGSFFTVPTHYVEVCQQVQRNLNKEFEAEQSQDAEVNIGQLDCKGLVGEFCCRVWHFLWLWRRFRCSSRKHEGGAPLLWGRGLPAGPDKVQAGNNALQLLLFLPLLSFWASVWEFSSFLQTIWRFKPRRIRLLNELKTL